MSERNHDCAWARERIEACLDDDLGAAEHDALRAHTAACPSCAAELALATRVRDALRALPRAEAPARVVDAAERAVRGGADAGTGNVIPLPGARRRRPGWIPAAAAALVLVLSGLWYDQRRRADTLPAELAGAGVTAAEVAEAQAGVEMAFAYVGRYSARAARVVEQDVIGDRVAPRVERALGESRQDAIDGALVPGLRRALNESGLGVTSPPPGRS
jgi:anti-sigma factor (TIGR02949 family)